MVDYTALLTAAMTARERAYVPYSHFKVGAALLTTSGTVFPGCNIENAAYPVCLCAERAAFAGAWSQGEHEFVALVVVADTDAPVSPCGMCRQFMFELAPDLPVLLANLAGDTRHTTPRDLLPGGFTKSDVLKELDQEE